MRLDGRKQIAGAPVVQEEYTLAKAPQWRRAEFIPAGITLRDSVRQRTSHVMNQQVGEHVHRLLGQSGDAREIGCHLFDMTKRTTSLDERIVTPLDGGRADVAIGGNWCRRSQQAHE